MKAWLMPQIGFLPYAMPHAPAVVEYYDLGPAASRTVNRENG
jgi:hypothetical protein